MPKRANQLNIGELRAFAENSRVSLAKGGMYYDPEIANYRKAFVEVKGVGFKYDEKFSNCLTQLGLKGKEKDENMKIQLENIANATLGTLNSAPKKRKAYNKMRQQFEESFRSETSESAPMLPSSPSAAARSPPLTPEPEVSSPYVFNPESEVSAAAEDNPYVFQPVSEVSAAAASAPGIENNSNVQLKIQEAGEEKQSDKPSRANNADGLQKQSRGRRRKHEQNNVGMGRPNESDQSQDAPQGNDGDAPVGAGGGETKSQDVPVAPPGPPDDGGGNPDGGGGGPPYVPDANAVGVEDAPTDTLVEVNRGIPGQPQAPVVPLGSMTSSTAQRVSMERNRMLYGAKKLLMEIRAFVQIYKDDIKTVHFKRLRKIVRQLTVKSPLVRLRKIHRELEEEVIDYYRNQSGLRMGVILDPGAVGLDVSQLQNILNPHMSFGGSGEVVRELATAADVGKFPETSQRAESVHYHHGGLAFATKSILPEGRNLDSSFNPRERNRLQNQRTGPIRTETGPKRRYMYQDKRLPFVPDNIKIKSVKC